jgi:hypothetical protein
VGALFPWEATNTPPATENVSGTTSEATRLDSYAKILRNFWADSPIPKAGLFVGNDRYRGVSCVYRNESALAGSQNPLLLAYGAS